MANFTLTVTVEVPDDEEEARLRRFAEQLERKLYGAEFRSIVVLVEASA